MAGARRQGALCRQTGGTQPGVRGAAADAVSAIASGVVPGKARCGHIGDTPRSVIPRSTMATTPLPPAVHTEISARPLPFSFSHLAAVAMMRAPVAARSEEYTSELQSLLRL